MKAAILEKTGPVENKLLEVSEIDKPKISGNEILLRIKACGVCHTDVHIAEGEIFKSAKLPLILGHEVVGIVEEKGEQAGNLEVGDRVGIGWNYSSCMSCKRCLEGRENLCAKKESTGYTKDGGYAQYGKFDSRFVAKIPEGLSFEEAAPLFCAGLTAYRTVKLAELRPNESVAVVGVGGLGIYAIQFAKLRGANVFAFSRNPEHLKLAEQFGVDEAVDSNRNLSEEIRKLGIDTALVFAPSAQVLEQALTGIGRGGRVMMAGNIEKTAAMNFRSALAGEKTLTTVTTGTAKDMGELLGLASDGEIRSKIEKMKLEDANEALARVKKGKAEGRIVLVNSW